MKLYEIITTTEDVSISKEDVMVSSDGKGKGKAIPLQV